MSTPLICYVLVGIPGSGKSTLAKLLSDRRPNYQIVSTDTIREQLYGDASIQGNWEAIEEKVFSQIHQAIVSGRPVIYDATNCQRTHRLDLLQKLACYKKVYWVALHLQTPLETCLAWNKKRSRQVPEAVIIAMYQSLKDFPPLPEEGFATIYPVSLTNTTVRLSTPD
ncbi:MAG TPA: ATP-binding protein [Candidatus Obscuribacterales bacterium]